MSEEGALRTAPSGLVSQDCGRVAGQSQTDRQGLSGAWVANWQKAERPQQKEWVAFGSGKTFAAE